MTAQTHQSLPVTFERVVCAIDGSGESEEGARQAARLAPGSPVTLVYVVDTLDAPVRASDYPAWAHGAREAGTAILSKARDQLIRTGVTAAVDVTVEEGDRAEALRYVAAPGGGEILLALGSGEEREMLEPSSPPPPTGVRLVERVVESVGCSVLVARRGPNPERFPSAITVGVDGSPASVHALGVAAAVAAGTGAALSVLTALGGKGPDLDALRDASPPIRIDRLEPDHPALALVRAAGDDGLVVVGNRGRHGLRALGSVSARVVARAPVSVLVVRGS